MRMLQALGFKCTFMPQNLAWMGHYTRNLQRMGVEVQYPPFVNSFSELLQSRGHEFDIVYVTRFYVAQQCIEDIRRSEEHTSELQSLMRTSYAVFCLKTKTHTLHQ